MKDWWQTLKASLGLNQVVGWQQDELRTRLLQSDFGHDTTEFVLSEWTRRLSTQAHHDAATSIQALQDLFHEIFDAAPLTLSPGEVITLWGVNGVGKTTTAGKLAYYLKQQGHHVLLAACDTFRAAAAEQLGILAERAGAAFIRAGHSHDPASVAFEAYHTQRTQGIDFCIIDTAGRIHHHQPLQEQSKKIIRVLQKQAADAPQHRWMVLDAHLGQNTLAQVRCFHEAVNINGLIVTKWDGTAKAGILTRIAHEFKLPIYFIANGEQLDDLEAFSSEKYIEKLLS